MSRTFNQHIISQVLESRGMMEVHGAHLTQGMSMSLILLKVVETSSLLPKQAASL